MIYMDNAATTKTRIESAGEVIRHMVDEYGNPSSTYALGMSAKETLDKARAIIADTIGAEPDEIYFTSGGTESNNWALRSVSGKVITSTIEHPSVINCCDPKKTIFIPPNKAGLVRPEDIQPERWSDVSLVSIMTANNEIGTIQPIGSIGEICREHNVLFHTDAVQAYGHIPINVNVNHIDLLSASGHKFGAPKGIGFLYIRRNSNIKSFICGGGQQNNMRSGTENVPGIAGMAVAAKLAHEEMHDTIGKVDTLRNYFFNELLKIDGVTINGTIDVRLPNNINVRIKGIEAESLNMFLDAHGVCASVGSACSSNTLHPSRTLKAIGLTDEEAHSSIRFSISAENTKEEIDEVVGLIRKWKEICNE